MTAVIDPNGQVVASAPQFEPSVVDAVVAARTGATPYTRTGNLPVLGVLALMLASGFFAGRRR